MFSNTFRILLAVSTLVLAMGAWACADTDVSSESTESPVEAAPHAGVADDAAANADLLADDEDEASEAAEKE